jgi:cell division inhibitor SepF
MTALHRVKAYFGMVPADELDSYDGYGDYADADRYEDDRFARRPRGDRYGTDGHEAYAGARYDDARHGSDRSDRYGSDRYSADRYGAGRYSADRYGSDRYDDHYEDRHEGSRHERSEAERFDADRFGSERPERPARGEAAHAEERPRTPKPRDPEPEVRADASRPGVDQDRTPSGDRDEEADVTVRSSARGRSWEHNTGPNHTSRSGRSGALASVGTGSSGSASSLSGSLSASGAAALALDEPVRRPEREVAAVPDAPALPEIVTLQPTSYNEARIIGERYRDGIPVIMNLTEMDDVAAKRLVDFAAGLAFALRGSIEKVTNRVFLLSPPNVEVSAADRRKFAEKSFSTAP